MSDVHHLHIEKKKKKKKIVSRSEGMWLTYIKSECGNYMSRVTDQALNEPNISSYINTRY